MAETLLLNSCYSPLAVISWRKAFTLWTRGLVEIIEEYSDKFINTVSAKFAVPSVVRFVKQLKNKRKIMKFSRENIWRRDGGKCQYCGQTVSRWNFTYDHVLPRSMGGKTTWTNIVVACVKCNQKKGGRIPDQAQMVLLKKPIAPTKLNWDIQFHKSQKLPESWTDYLYWNVKLEE